MKPIEPMFLILFLALFCYKGFPQDINIKNRLSLKSIYVPYRTNLYIGTGDGFEKKKSRQLSDRCRLQNPKIY